MSDTWDQLQAHKRKREDLKERLAKRRRERQNILDAASTDVVKTEEKPSTIAAAAAGVTIPAPSSNTTELSSSSADNIVKDEKPPKNEESVKRSKEKSTTSHSKSPSKKQREERKKKKATPEELEKILALQLGDKLISLPAKLPVIVDSVNKDKYLYTTKEDTISALLKLEAQNLLHLTNREDVVTIQDCEYIKLKALHGNTGSNETQTSKPSTRENDRKSERKDSEGPKDDLETLLSMPTMKESENKKIGNEILELINQPTAKELSLAEKFRSQGGAMVREFCPYGTRDECYRSNAEKSRCKKLHFKKIIQLHTDEHLGDCSFLNTCFHMDTCKYVHYEVDTRGAETNTGNNAVKVNKSSDLSGGKITMTPPQWIQCDVRKLDYDVLGKFAVVMADPPWDIHMELPYGTMSDNEMKAMAVHKLQDHGYIFLWVTGRAIELGRECLEIWGYKRVDELIWVKTNQLQRLIRTGRTGHWINHGKEHCIIGKKGRPDPNLFNYGLDCDVLVSEVRDTSHKPDEVYGLIERLAPGQRKIEMFGRMHNVQPNWITLGNQLAGVNLVEPDVIKRFQERYPSGSCLPQAKKPDAPKTE